MSDDTRLIAERAGMALTGGLAGLAGWGLIDILPDMVENGHLLIVLTSAVAGYFAVLLALCGPVTIRRAMVGAALLAVPAALLLGWASFGFETPEGFFDTGFSFLAWCTILVVGTPFLAVWLWDRQFWNSYLDLFEISWSIVVRYSAAWLFVGVFWAVLFLCDALLSLVQINIIEELLDIDAVPFVLTGAVLGLALRVVYEMRDYLSPVLLLRLFRLLLPIFLVVVLIFVAALPLSDLSEVFGGLSPAATLMAVALGGICLISISLDKSDADAVQAPWMQWATRILGLLLPVLAGLAGYGIWLRVVQYGWTPERLAAAVAAIVIAGYSVTYFVSILRGGEWMRRIRRRNLWMAGGLLGLSVLWLSPVVNPEAISTRSQVARYLNGNVSVDQAAVWEMAHEWGKAGQKGLAKLEALEGEEHADLRTAIASARTASGRYAYRKSVDVDMRDSSVADLLPMIRVLPDHETLDAAALEQLAPSLVLSLLEDCAPGEGPGCVLLLAEFQPGAPQRQGLFFRPVRSGKYGVFSVRYEGDTLVIGRLANRLPGGARANLGADQMRMLLEGDYRIAPASRNALWLDGLELYPEN